MVPVLSVVIGEAVVPVTSVVSLLVDHSVVLEVSVVVVLIVEDVVGVVGGLVCGGVGVDVI